MTASATPYRAKPRGRKVAFAVYPLLIVRLLIVVGVIAAIVSVLHLFLWSRVVHIRCLRTADSVVCAVDESSLVLSNRFERDASVATRASLRGAVARSRGDTWIVLVQGWEEVPLTSGFNGAKGRQQAAAEELTEFFRGNDRSVEVSYGSRWGTAWIFLVLFGGLFVLTYPLFGYRVRVAIDHREGTLAIERGPWPFSRRVGAVRLATFTGFRVEGDSRVRLVVTTNDQPSVPCTLRLGSSALLNEAADRLNAWVLGERERPVES